MITVSLRRASHMPLCSAGTVALFVAAIEDATFSHPHLPYLESARACLSVVAKSSPASSSAAEQCSLILPPIPPACAHALGVCICRHWISTARLWASSLPQPSQQPSPHPHSPQPVLTSRMRALCLHVSHGHLPVLRCIARCSRHLRRTCFFLMPLQWPGRVLAELGRRG